MELNAALRVRNLFTQWAARTDGAVWVSPVSSRRGVEVGLVVADSAVGLDAAIQEAVGPECRHTVELVQRDSGRVCLRYRCSQAGASGCGLAGPVLEMLRPLLGTTGFVHLLRFERHGAQARLVWPPGGPDAAAAIHDAIGAHQETLERVGFRLLDLRDTSQSLIEASRSAPQLKGNELETMLVALRYGYYESPRQCTMEDIAGHFGLSKSAIYHRMHAAEREAVRHLASASGQTEPRRTDAKGASSDLE